eukprot:CAMPEP_0172679198 /NCGR_PEP_ID=MMETSP1074-20121228/15907_1 /TAXON_ID=2916 /ORGANISM="Ceratium fusus, Strain PA161109" /LENGTH=40 /DNA_ID= /DNA_START= /DNA_END= /DNA_ORIENTATION=
MNMSVPIRWKVLVPMNVVGLCIYAMVLCIGSMEAAPEINF